MRLRTALLFVAVAVTTTAVASCQGQSTIRVWGSPQMSGVMRLWEQGFRTRHPEIRFHDELHGTASSIAGLYTGVADIALMGREIWPIETLAFESVFPWKPLEIEVATGSYDIPKATYALVVYVHPSNPLSQVTLQQLAAAFGHARRWDDLGLTGEWTGKPVHKYSFDYENDKSVFFRRRLLKDRYRWESSATEFSGADAGQLILDALAGDALGIAISNPHYANRSVKPLAIGTPGWEKPWRRAPKRFETGGTRWPVRSIFISIAIRRNQRPPGPASSSAMSSAPKDSRMLCATEPICR